MTSGGDLRVGVAHHFGWAVAVTAAADHRVVDRRRLELIEPGVPVAPVHNEAAHHDDEALASLVERVRRSVERACTAALDQLVADVGDDISTICLRSWPDDFPTDIAVLRRSPHEARADSVMYREVLRDCGRARGWSLFAFDAATVERDAERLLGDRAEPILRGPRATLGPPWAADHRIALAATVLSR